MYHIYESGAIYHTKEPLITILVQKLHLYLCVICFGVLGIFSGGSRNLRTEFENRCAGAGSALSLIFLYMYVYEITFFLSVVEPYVYDLVELCCFIYM